MSVINDALPTFLIEQSLMIDDYIISERLRVCTYLLKFTSPPQILSGFR